MRSRRHSRGTRRREGPLGATADWRRITEEIWPWVDAAPTTELGRAEAAWRAARPMVEAAGGD